MPVSVNAMSTYAPGAVPTCCRVKSVPSVTFCVSMVSLPPSGMASRAFTTRLTITCSICAASARTEPSAVRRGARSP